MKILKLIENWDEKDKFTSTYYVAMDNNQIVGRVRIDTSESNLNTLSGLYVILSMRSKGIGSELIKSVLNDFKEVWLECKISKAKYYEHFGFRIIEEYSENDWCWMKC